MNIPRVIIAGIYADCGKTTVAIGLMGALMKKGLKVQAFKVGSDYIDATYHSEVTKEPSRHLDAWLTSPRTVLDIFERSSKNADISVIEGAMGLFDGVTRFVEGTDDFGSTAQIGKILRSPIILVLDVYGIRMHGAAVVHGFKSFDEQVNVKGVVLNNVRDRRQAEWMKTTIESAAKVPVIGVIPYNAEILLPTRLGGLIPIPERKTLKTSLSKLVEYVGEHIDVDKIFDVTKKAEDLPEIESEVYPSRQRPKQITIGVAFDEAFNFLNQDNIDLLKAYGAEIVFFSPIHDTKLPPNLDGLYIPGGFPDVLAEQLTENQTMRKSIKEAVDDEIPTYSEHGGLLYLTQSITNFEGLTFPMVGALPGRALMDKKLQALDFTLMETINNNMLNRRGNVVHGYEFHFSKMADLPKDVKFAYKMRIGKGIDGIHEGWLGNNFLALHGHLHFAFSTKFAENFSKHCEQYQHK